MTHPGPGKDFVPLMFDTFGLGIEYLGGQELLVAATRVGPVNFRPRDVLFIVCRITGMSAVDAPALRFNGDAGSNYWTRTETSPAGGSTFNGVATASTNMLRLHSLTSTAARLAMVVVMNRSASSKNVTGEVALSSGSAATVGSLNVMAGEWVNTASQIQAVEMITVGGTATMGVESGFGIFGKDFP